jgi:inorganic phosphate transporter, PiT family
MLTLVIVIVASALLFDFLNGFHDAANSIATVVSTRVLSPMSAVVWAAFFNFAAFLILGTRVAKTIGGDMVRIDLIPSEMRLYVLLAGILGAVVWNILTWYLALPTSSSHALIGGYAGAAITAHQGFEGLLNPEGWFKTLLFIVASPLFGMFLGFTFMIIVYWIFRKWSLARVDTKFRRGQLISAALFSLGHGGNDAQKTMGIITAVLVSGGMIAGG